MSTGHTRDDNFGLVIGWQAAGVEPARPHPIIRTAPILDQPPSITAATPVRHHLACHPPPQAASPLAGALRNRRERKLKSP
jgi:hypothetical protein